MKYTDKLKQKGFEILIMKDFEDDKGYDLYITIKEEEFFSKTFYSMSHSKGFYFTKEHTDCNGDGCDWDFDVDKIVCEYLVVEKLIEIS